MKRETSLELALSQLKKQNEIYQPTEFWAAACEQISKELMDEGIERFRRNSTALNFFVPNFGAPASGLSQEQVVKLTQTLNEKYPTQTKSHQTLELFTQVAKSKSLKDEHG